MNKKAVYFPGLNTIRFLAAFMVILSHIEGFKIRFNLPMSNFIHKAKMIEQLGRLGVILFFVLSGFLISYLLLVEKETFHTIAIRKFYYRRMLRIWPLYYLLLFLSLVVFPNTHSMQIPGTDWLTREGITIGVILLSIFFLSNVATIIFPKIPYFFCTWSLGVEEQFYLICPFIIKKFKNISLVLFSIIIFYLLIKVIAFPFIKFKLHYWNSNMNLLLWIWNDFLIDTMAIGALFAYAYYKKNKVLKFFYNPIVYTIAYSLIIFIFLKQINIPYLTNEVFAFLFAILILNVSTNYKKAKFFNLPLFDYLGKISYGIYMYHTICIVITIKLMIRFNIYSNSFLYIVCVATTLGLSMLSYHYFESYFLTWKNKFTKVKSTNSKLEVQ